MSTTGQPGTCSISHGGIVESIGDTHVSVRIVQHTACDTCRAKYLCTGNADAQDSVVEALIADPAEKSQFFPGGFVTIDLEESMAWLTIVLAFGLPLILLVATFFLVLARFNNEAIAGIAGLAVLVPYYLTLGLNRHRLHKRVYFTARAGEHGIG